MSGKLNDRPLPSLAQWLGDGARADGFEEWVAESVIAERHVADEGEASALRLLRILCIAMVEACRVETDIHGRDHAETVTRLGRCCGVALMAAQISILDGDKKPPLLRIARIFAAEFAHGARTMAESTLRLEAREAEGP